MADQLRLRVVLDMAERVLAPMKRISGASGETARALKAARDRLKELNDQQGAVANVQKQAAELARLNNTLKVKQALLEGMRASGTATTAQLKREENGVRKLAEALELQKAAAVKARSALNGMGITGNLSAAQARLKTDIDGATAAMGKQRAELQRLATQQRQLQTLRDQHAKAMMHTGMAAGAGVAMQAAGSRGVQLGMGPVASFSQHENAMLGVARQVPGARNEMGQLTEVYRQAERDVRALSGQIPIATTEIAAMFAAAARLEVPTSELKEFTLLASEMATAFDAVPSELAESMGKVAKNFNIPLPQIRALADSINYLDDNSISKGADLIDFMNRVGGVASVAKASANDYAALGSTLLTLGETPENAATAVKFMMGRFAAATKGTKPFKAALDEIGMSTEAVQRGMSTDAMGTMDKVLTAIRALPEDKRVGVLVELVGQDHFGKIAKLLDKPEELARQRELANGAGATGSMSREAAARNATLAAQWQMTKNRAFNLGATIGSTLAPALTKLMEKVNPLIESFTEWVAENPNIVKWVLGTAVSASALLAAVGMLLVPLAILAGKAMLVRFVFARLALGAGTGARAFALLRGGAGLLWSGLTRLLGFLSATPLGRAFALLAFSATMVYQNWEGIKGGLVAIWEGVVGRVKEALSGGVRAWAALLMDFSPLGILYSVLAFALDSLGIELPARFSTLGSNMIQGLVNGITAGAVWVKDAVVDVASSAASWFAEKLGIASPSRLFMQYGGWISEGAALGIQGGQGAVRTAALAMATAASASMPMAADAAAMRIDNRGPLMAQAPAGAPVGGGAMNISITINAAPGQDPQAIARAVAAEFDRRARSDRSRVLSQIHDID